MITLDTTTNGLADDVTSLTFSITVSASANKLIVHVAAWGGGRVITGVTFNGVALTQAVQHDNAGVTNSASVWYLDAPASGAHDVVVTATSNAFIRAAAVSLIGAKTGGADATAGGSYSSATNGKTTSITTTVANCWLFDAITDQNNAMTATSPQVDNFDAGDTTSRGSYKTDVSAGSNSMDWTWTGTDEGVHAIAAFAPAVTAKRDGFFPMMQ